MTTLAHTFTFTGSIIGAAAEARACELDIEIAKLTVHLEHAADLAGDAFDDELEQLLTDPWKRDGEGCMRAGDFTTPGPVGISRTDNGPTIRIDQDLWAALFSLHRKLHEATSKRDRFRSQAVAYRSQYHTGYSLDIGEVGYFGLDLPGAS